MGFCLSGVCLSGVISEWGFVQWGYVQWGYVRVGFCPGFVLTHAGAVIVDNEVVVAHDPFGLHRLWTVTGRSCRNLTVILQPRSQPSGRNGTVIMFSHCSAVPSAKSEASSGKRLLTTRNEFNE